MAEYPLNCSSTEFLKACRLYWKTQRYFDFQNINNRKIKIIILHANSTSSQRLLDVYMNYTMYGLTFSF